MLMQLSWTFLSLSCLSLLYFSPLSPCVSLFCNYLVDTLLCKYGHYFQTYHLYFSFSLFYNSPSIIVLSLPLGHSHSYTYLSIAIIAIISRVAISFSTSQIAPRWASQNNYLSLSPSYLTVSSFA